MDNKTNTKKSKQLVSASVFIALYFVVFMVIGMICMPVPVLYLMMTSLIAIVAGSWLPDKAAIACAVLFAAVSFILKGTGIL